MVVALNLIINSENAREGELCEEDPGHVDLKGKSCLLLAACLEGQGTGGVVHRELCRRLDTNTLKLQKRRFEMVVHGIVSKQVASCASYLSFSSLFVSVYFLDSLMSIPPFSLEGVFRLLLFHKLPS